MKKQKKKTPDKTVPTKKADVSKTNQEKVQDSIVLVPHVDTKMVIDERSGILFPQFVTSGVNEELLDGLLLEEEDEEEDPPEGEEDDGESSYISKDEKEGRYGGKTETYRSGEKPTDLYVKELSEDGTGYLGEGDLASESLYRGGEGEEDMETVYSDSTQENVESDALTMDAAEGTGDYIQESDQVEEDSQALDTGIQVASEYIERVETSVSANDYVSAKGNVLETADYMSGQQGHSCGGCAVNTIYSMRDEVLAGTYVGDFDASSILDAVDRLSPTLEQFRGMHTHQRQIVTGGIG